MIFKMSHGLETSAGWSTGGAEVGGGGGGGVSRSASWSATSGNNTF
jgi:hypothetical protein